MDSSRNYLEQPIVPNDVKLLAIPTTAGTGSEATRYAVIYYNGVKQSVADESCIPSAVLMDSSVLKTLPLYQKKSTMLDALCHALAAFHHGHSEWRRFLEGFSSTHANYLSTSSRGGGGAATHTSREGEESAGAKGNKAISHLHINYSILTLLCLFLPFFTRLISVW